MISMVRINELLVYIVFCMANITSQYYAFAAC